MPLIYSDSQSNYFVTLNTQDCEACKAETKHKTIVIESYKTPTSLKPHNLGVKICLDCFRFDISGPWSHTAQRPIGDPKKIDWSIGNNS